MSAENLFEQKREHLKNLSDEELKNRFWDLAEKIVNPLIDLAQGHTSPSIERSVLLRMGFDSFQSAAIAEKVNQAGLLGKGAGNVVLKLAEREKIPYLDAGKQICEKDVDFSGLF